MRRTGTMFACNMGSWRIPGHGEVFVRLLKSDGQPGIKVDRHGPDDRAFGDTPIWQLADG